MRALRLGAHVCVLDDSLRLWVHVWEPEGLPGGPVVQIVLPVRGVWGASLVGEPDSARGASQPRKSLGA